MSFIKWTNKFNGLRFRLTFVYSTLFGLFICIFAFFISNEYLRSNHRDFDSALLNFAIDISEELNATHKTIPKRELLKDFPFPLKKSFYMVRSIEGKIELGNDKFEIPYNKEMALRPDYTHRFLSIETPQGEFRAVNLKLSKRHQNKILQVATSSAILSQQKYELIILNLILLPLLIGISSIASYVIAGNAMTPITILSATANRIAAQNLSLRVPVLNTKDEIEDLSHTFNHLLERLEKSFKAQENFVANASHQLNTPLSIMKGELDVLESKERSMEEYQRFHKSLREELERLIDLVKNMLLVSRVESGLENFSFYPIRLDEILLSTTSRLRSKALEKKISLRFNMSESIGEESLIISGDRQLLTCLFENLLDNAIKYSPPETVVGLDVYENSAQELEVSISDEGPGIPENEVAHIFNTRFQRGSGSLLPGTGIGLSIAQQIATYHHAVIKFSQRAPRGSVFNVRFSKIF